MKLCIKNIKANTIICEAEKAKSDEMARDFQLMICANDLYAEIKSRYDSLSEKCEISLSDLGDYEILSVKKREDHFNLEVRELIDKVTAYAQFVSPCREKGGKLPRNK